MHSSQAGAGGTTVEGWDDQADRPREELLLAD